MNMNESDIFQFFIDLCFDSIENIQKLKGLLLSSIQQTTDKSAKFIYQTPIMCILTLIT